MGSMAFEKGTKERDMFQDYWRICQLYWIPEETDEYWIQLMKATNEFYEKYKEVDQDFVETISVGYINSREQRMKKEKKSE